MIFHAPIAVSGAYTGTGPSGGGTPGGGTGPGEVVVGTSETGGTVNVGIGVGPQPVDGVVVIGTLYPGTGAPAVGGGGGEITYVPGVDVTIVEIINTPIIPKPPNTILGLTLDSPIITPTIQSLETGVATLNFTDTFTVTPSGGTGPYTYEWFAQTEGQEALTITDRDTATPTFSIEFERPGQVVTYNVQVNVTDAYGNTGVAFGQIRARREFGSGG